MADTHSLIPSADARCTTSDAQVGDRESQAMTLANPSQLIVAVVGPTASGKSDLALDLAEELGRRWGANGGQIVSADALQLYRGMDVGTAKTPLGNVAGFLTINSMFSTSVRKRRLPTIRRMRERT